jgi:hypothetical protein
MEEQTLLALARAVQQAHAQLADEVRDRSEQARFLADEAQRRLEGLVSALRDREDGLDELHEAIADRMNNLLMAIKTARDLLRTPDEQCIVRVREHLDATVDKGRHAVKGLRDSLGPLR